MKTFLITALVLFLIYIIILMIAYFNQERLIFFPTKLSSDYEFRFPKQAEEIYITTKDSIKLNALLFKADSSKGLIFYLHGNAGALDSWGWLAQTYTTLNYDVFILDYRGYGKSEGKIHSQQQFFDDVQLAYDLMKSRYPENKITVLGYSIGSGSAAMIAAKNNPKQLILQAPYYNLTDLTKKLYPYAPTFILKYKFETNKFLPQVKAPVVLFHGDQDEVIYYGSSEKLATLLKPGDEFITLKGVGHNGMTEDAQYLKELRRVLK